MLKQAICTGFAIIVAAAVPAAAQQPVDNQTVGSSTLSNQVVVRDSESGELRPPSASESAALRSQGAASLPPSTLRTVPQSHPSGGYGVRLTDEFLSYSMMVRQPDGRLLEYCFESREAAEAVIKGAPISPSKNRNLPTE